MNELKEYEDVLRMARDAGLNPEATGTVDNMLMFAALVREGAFVDAYAQGYSAGKRNELETCCTLLEGMHEASSVRHNYYLHAAQSLRQLRGKK